MTRQIGIITIEVISLSHSPRYGEGGERLRSLPVILKPILSIINYRKFSNGGATPYRGSPPPFLVPSLLSFWTFLAISQPKIVRFPICKKPLQCEIVPSLMIAHPKGFPTRPAPLLGNLR